MKALWPVLSDLGVNQSMIFQMTWCINISWDTKVWDMEGCCVGQKMQKYWGQQEKHHDKNFTLEVPNIEVSLLLTGMLDPSLEVYCNQEGLTSGRKTFQLGHTTTFWGQKNNCLYFSTGFSKNKPELLGICTSWLRLFSEVLHEFVCAISLQVSLKVQTHNAMSTKVNRKMTPNHM